MITTKAKIILASNSAIRHSLLTSAGVDFEAIPSPFNEEVAKLEFSTETTIEQRALSLAKGKARAISQIHRDAYVIGADQICALENEGLIFSKPKVREVAIAHLLALAGKTHSQVSGISICKDGEEIWAHCEKSYILVRNLTKQEVEHYVDLDEPFLAAGGYCLEKNAKHLFVSIDGNEDNILGLPLVPILNFLYSYGVISL